MATKYQFSVRGKSTADAIALIGHGNVVVSDMSSMFDELGSEVNAVQAKEEVVSQGG